MSERDAIAHRLEEIHRRLERACQRSGRRREEVTLVGVSKGQPLEKLIAAYQAGLRVFGENRVQEAEAKVPELPPDAQWHLIGPLQSNKAKKAAELFQVFHTLDRLKIARRLDRDAAGSPDQRVCFLEINLGREASKHGFDPDSLHAHLEELSSFPNLRIAGLMAIPPYEEDPATARRWFAELRRLRDEMVQVSGYSSCPGWLSMGMSHDFEDAVAEGATHVRVGSALFGPRRTASP